MDSEWKQNSMVRSGGRVEVTVPELKPGESVEVSIRRTQDAPSRMQRPVGLLKGRIWIAESFDEPLEEFDPYTS